MASFKSENPEACKRPLVALGVGCCLTIAALCGVQAYEEDAILFKAASIDSDLFIGEDQLSALASLKSKQELIGEIITLLQSPAKNVLTLLQSGEHKLAGIVKTLSEREN